MGGQEHAGKRLLVEAHNVVVVFDGYVVAVDTVACQQSILGLPKGKWGPRRVHFDYGTPGSCNGRPDMTFTVVQFKWQVDHVEVIGTPPKSYA